jgi:rRNA maturation endonuclease Nob1
MNTYDTYECPNCGERITLPSDMNVEDQLEIAHVFRSRKKLEAVIVARGKNYLGNLSECKSVVFHVSDPRGFCVRCGHKLLETGVTYCFFCSELNLNW